MYMYETSFTDGKNQDIEIKVEDSMDYISAYHRGTEVGRFDFWSDDDYGFEFVLMHMNVKQAYQEAGIGTEMMRVAVKCCTAFAIPPFPISPLRRSDFVLTLEGGKLVNSCVAKGIIQESWIVGMAEDDFM